MNRKTIIFSGIILILIGIGLWHFGMFNRYNYLTAKSDIANNSPQKILVGELLISPIEMNKVSRNYGFKNVGFGCIVSGNELNGIEIYNAEIDKYLTDKNGTDWKINYQKEIDSLTELKQLEWSTKSDSDFVTFLSIMELKNATKDGVYLNGYVVNLQYDELIKYDNKKVKVSGKVSVVKGIEKDKNDGLISQGREIETKHIENPKIEIIE